MEDLQFEAQAQWSGTGKQGAGTMIVGEQSFEYSAPASMGGQGIGYSPEDLLVSAVTACYSGTLFGVLTRRKLAVKRVGIRAVGQVAGYPTASKFARLVVHPTIYGGDEALAAAYVEAAAAARERCFIGKTIAGNVAYEVGEVKVVRLYMEQEQVNELVDRFYARLSKEPYYIKLFSERGVDLEVMKERQRAFIARLANTRFSTAESESQQVRSRHSFAVSPDAADNWLGHMETTMVEMALEPTVMAALLEKIRGLARNMTNAQ